MSQINSKKVLFNLPVLNDPNPSEQIHLKDIRAKKINIVSLGCPKNQVDSEVILGNLKQSIIVDKAEDADTIVINTCGFIESAKKESIDTIFEAIRLKKEFEKKGIKKEIIVTGCLSERYRTELTASMPEVDSFYGVHEFDKVTERIEGHYQQISFTERVLLNQKHYAYLKISEGCNQRCGFCYIPMIRGNLVSKSIDQNYREAVLLADRGVKELICVSQDTSSYGYDLDRSAPNLKRNFNLVQLLNTLSTVEGIEWIRVMYLYPSLFSDELIECIAQNPKICKYIDLPVQHISDNMLKSMRRNTSKKQTSGLLHKIKQRIPELALRTSMIVGYPGETEQDFQELCDFVTEFQFDRLGVFVYSREEGTYAFDLNKQVPEKVKKERYNKLMNLQQTISLNKNLAKIDKTCRVLIDIKDGERYVGRTQYDAPEIDNEVIIETDQSLQIGNFVNVHITDASEYDLFGKPV
ncbi:30S ribosomal protein S12 methylthiotransferase RimO [bacterium]|nr:MAG: 30S ribosomal protein S12 methylthiotransferase RimO [bacterium]